MAAEDIRLTKLAECAGCGAKVGAGELAELLGSLPRRRDPNLLVGFDTSDDAAVYRITDDVAVVQTIDFFPPISDDPYTYGAIAAANALSDVYAMGGRPVVALNVMAVPQDMPRDAVHEILRGGYEKVCEAGATIAGGHSIYDREPKYGLAVTGVVDPARMLSNAGARPGDVLVYTKRLGAGIQVTAAREGLVPAARLAEVEASMMTLNRAARDVVVAHDVHAVTDVTGFGLLGHLVEMAVGSDTCVMLDADAPVLFEGTRELARLGVIPAGAYRNRHFAEARCDLTGVPLDLADALFSPETSGGLCVAVAPGDADALLSDLAASQGVPCAVRLGEVVAADGSGVRVVAHSQEGSGLDA